MYLKHYKVAKELVYALPIYTWTLYNIVTSVIWSLCVLWGGGGERLDVQYDLMCNSLIDSYLIGMFLASSCHLRI